METVGGFVGGGEGEVIVQESEKGLGDFDEWCCWLLVGAKAEGVGQRN